jgi:hypothetical protein
MTAEIVESELSSDVALSDEKADLAETSNDLSRRWDESWDEWNERFKARSAAKLQDAGGPVSANDNIV